MRIFILLLLLSFDVSAMNVNKYLSGSWFNASQNGHGISIEVISDEETVIYWYVYHPDGTPTFILATGTNHGNVVEAQAYYNSGMHFGEFDPDDRTEIPWGDIKITFQSCDSATLEYSSDLSYNGEPWGSGSIPLTRLLSIDGVQCASNPNAGLYQGTFHSDSTGEDTDGFSIIAPNGEFVAVSFGAVAGFGSLTVSSDKYSGGGTAVSANPEVDFDVELTVSGSIDPEYRLTGSYKAKNEDQGYFDLWSVPSLYRRGITLEAIAGTYDSENIVTREDGSMTLSASGKITGKDDDGCKYDGNLTVPDEHFNLLEVSFKVSSCGSLNGTYTGYGAQLDYFKIGDRRIIRLFTSDGENAGLLDLFD